MNSIFPSNYCLTLLIANGFKSCLFLLTFASNHRSSIKYVQFMNIYPFTIPNLITKRVSYHIEYYYTNLNSVKLATEWNRTFLKT